MKPKRNLTPASGERLLAGPADFLSLLSPGVRELLMEGSQRVILPAGTVVHATVRETLVAVIERGLVRIFQASDDGRQASIAYSHKRVPGRDAASDTVAEIHAQVVVPTTLLRLEMEHVRRLFAARLEVANAIALHLGARLARSCRVIAVRSLGTMRERLAYDLSGTRLL